MNTKTKLIIVHYLIFLSIFLFIWFILDNAFQNLDNPYIGMISAGFAGLLSPRLKTFDTQAGQKLEFEWIFLKKLIRFYN